MLDIAVILPCKGRHEQTIRNAARLKSQAVHEAQWIAVGGPDERRLLQYLQTEQQWQPTHVVGNSTYWIALKIASDPVLTSAPLLCAVANDLIPSPHWLRRGAEAYAARFGDEPGLMGFNGDGHGPEHSCHMLIHRDLLAQFGGWPTWYHHNFGDTELCLRADKIKRYGKAAWAVLFHDHPYFGGQDDAVYAEGRSRAAEDEALFKQRRLEGGW